MKKTNTILILLLLFTTSLFAQGKLKKETTTFPQYKKIALFDKNNGKLLCSESWDSTRLLSSAKSMTYRKIVCQYDAQNRIITDDYTERIFEADGKKRSSNRSLYKTKYGNPIVRSTLHWNSENTLIDSTRKEEKYTSDNLMLESTTTNWKAPNTTAFLSKKWMFEYNDARCLVSSKYFDYDSLQQEIGFSKRYYTRTNDCYTDTYINTNKLNDTIVVSKNTYKNNKKDIFTRSTYGFINFCYEQSDSVHVIKNDDGHSVSEKNWWGNMHLFKDYSYLKNGKLDAVYTDFVESKASGKKVDFYHYDTLDSLILVENYFFKNGKIDSSEAYTLREIIYERDDAGRFSMITDRDDCGASTITYLKYDCNSHVKEKIVSDFHETTYIQLEYFDYPCNDVPIVENTISVYPNPTQDVLNVETNENQQLKKIDLYDLQGRLIQSFNANVYNTYTALNISTLRNGTYFIVAVLENGKTASQRFVKY